MIAFRQLDEADLTTLTSIGMADTARQRLASDHAGWIASVDGAPAGFAMADRTNGELCVVAVRPEYQRQAIGRELMRQAEAWLFSHGWAAIWLTLPDGQDYGSIDFFSRLGWTNGDVAGERRLTKDNPRSVIALEEHTVTGANTGYKRLVRLQRGPAQEAHALCLFLDGEHYWRDMDAVPLLNDLVADGSIPAMTFAFVGHVSAAARHEDYTCNERYGRYIGEEVVAWLKNELPTLRERDHVVVGLSLSGLMATDLALEYPRHFTYCLSQSGSHWWNPEWCAAKIRKQTPLSTRFWLSVGDQETAVNVKHPPTGLLQEISQIAGVENAAQLLEEAGGAVHYNTFHGRHSVQSWRHDLGQALPWLLKRL